MFISFRREPQKCYCGTEICRGWLGEAPDQKTREEKDQEKKEEKFKKRRDEKKAYFDDMDVSVLIHVYYLSKAHN